MTQASRVPTPSILFGYGPMIPFVLGALGVWSLRGALPGIALQLTLIWGALILSFVAGVRRGFGMERRGASTAVEIATMIPYVMLAGCGLILPPLWGTLSLAAGFSLAAMVDTRAARRGDAPSFFARLRPYQFPIAVISLLAIALRIVR